MPAAAPIVPTRLLSACARPRSSAPCCRRPALCAPGRRQFSRHADRYSEVTTAHDCLPRALSARLPLVFLIIGLLIVFGSVIGGYVMHHGQIGVLIQVNEFIIIGGAGLGAMIVANPIGRPQGRRSPATLGLLKPNPFSHDGVQRAAAGTLRGLPERPQGRPRRPRGAHRGAGEERHLHEVSRTSAAQRPRRRAALRHAEGAAHRRRRGPQPRRDPRHRPRSAARGEHARAARDHHGRRRDARLRHRRRGARRHHHDGLDRRRGERDRREGRRGARRHVPRHPARLRHARPDGEGDREPRQGGARLHVLHPHRAALASRAATRR